MIYRRSVTPRRPIGIKRSALASRPRWRRNRRAFETAKRGIDPLQAGIDNKSVTAGNDPPVTTDYSLLTLFSQAPFRDAWDSTCVRRSSAAKRLACLCSAFMPSLAFVPSFGVRAFVRRSCLDGHLFTRFVSSCVWYHDVSMSHRGRGHPQKCAWYENIDCVCHLAHSRLWKN